MSIGAVPDLIASFAELVLATRDPAVLWPAMLQRLQAEIGFDSGYVAGSWGGAMDGRGAVVGHHEPTLKRNLDRFLEELAPEEVATYATRARRHAEVWPALRRKELAVFNEVLEPMGIKHVLVRASWRQGNVVGFNLERTAPVSDFSDRDLALVDAVTPFLHIVEIMTLERDSEEQVDGFAQAHGLSRRETEFLGFTIRGMQNAEIALLTGVSMNRVRNALVRIFDKVGVSNRAELTYLATRRPSVDERARAPVPAKRPAAHGAGRGLRAFARRVEVAATPDAILPVLGAVSPQIIYTPPGSV